MDRGNQRSNRRSTRRAFLPTPPAPPGDSPEPGLESPGDSPRESALTPRRCNLFLVWISLGIGLLLDARASVQRTITLASPWQRQARDNHPSEDRRIVLRSPACVASYVSWLTSQVSNQKRTMHHAAGQPGIARKKAADRSIGDLASAHRDSWSCAPQRRKQGPIASIETGSALLGSRTKIIVIQDTKSLYRLDGPHSGQMVVFVVFKPFEKSTSI